MKKGMEWIDLSFFKRVSSVTLFIRTNLVQYRHIQTTGFDSPIRKGEAI